MEIKAKTGEGKRFDCDEEGCGVCEVCEYLSFREYAESCAPVGSHIERNLNIEAHLQAKQFSKRQTFRNLGPSKPITEESLELCRAEMLKNSREWNDEMWKRWAEESNICHICSNERTVCGGEEKHG